MKMIGLFLGFVASTVLAAEPPPSNTIRATRVIHFEAGAQKRAEIIADIAGNRVHTTSMENVVASMLGVDGQVASVLFSAVVDPPTNEITVTVDVPLANQVRDGRIPLNRASEVADTITQSLINSLTPPSQQDLQDAMEKRDQLRARRDRLASELHDVQSSLRKEADAVDVSPATIRQLLASLQTQRESLSLDLVAKQARAEALTEQVAKFSEQLAKKVDDDPVAKELQTVVEYQQKSMERLQAQQKAGVVTNAEADKAVADLAEARAKLLERKSVAAAAAGGDTLAAWNKELMTLAVDKAELNARLKEINGRLDRLTDAGDVLDRIEQMRGQLADLSKPLADADAAVADLQLHAERDRVEFKLLPDKSTNDPAPATQPAN